MLVKNISFPCIYDKKGCIENLTLDQVAEHERVCPYRNVSCLLNCMWQGPVTELREHFETSHDRNIIRDGIFEVESLNSYETHSLLLYEDELFNFKREYIDQDNILKYSVSCLQAIDATTKYNYEITIENSNKTRSVSFPIKSAQGFEQKNVTEINVEQLRNKLDDPSIIVAKIKISENLKKEAIKEQKEKIRLDLDMLRELECPVCMDYIIPPIYQCSTGHSICGECKLKISQCPTCFQEIGGSHNITLEKMVYQITYPCKYTEYGCDFFSKPIELKQHQNFCLHGPHECPLQEYTNCTWKSAAKDIFEHVHECHFDNILEIDTVSEFIDENYFNVSDRSGHILKYGSSLFKLHYYYNSETFSWAVQLIGPSEEAVGFKFEIDIVDENKNGRRLFVKSICSHLTKAVDAFTNPEHYVFLKLDQVGKFISSDAFTYKLRITK